MAANDTESSTLALEADLTEIHAPSGLPFAHTSWRTKSGFLVTGDRLFGYFSTSPTKFGKRKWMWDYGESISRNLDGEPHFLCRICWDDPTQSKRTLTPAHATLIRRHLYTYGFNKDGARTEKERKRDSEDIAESLKRQRQAQETVFDLDDWQATFGT
jgi:hypothetical protein